MKRILLGCLFALLFSAGNCSDDDSNTTTTDITTHIPTVETTITSEATTIAPVTTTVTPEPETTTHTQTTYTEPVSTTATATVTPSVPATTKAPEPIPKPENGSWNVTQNNVTCIRAELAILFVIPGEEKKMYIALSPNATTDDSDCSLTNTTQKLVLTHDNYDFTMVFEKAAGKAYVKNITLNYTSPEGKIELVYNDEKKFSVNVGHSYQCRSQEDISLENVTMKVMDIHIQAFGDKDNKDFTAAEECEADDKVGDAVPIAVACALAALIIVVLIAYLVGRRRSRQRGYQSV